MSRRVHPARGRPGAVRLVAASLLLCAGAAAGQEPRAAGPAPVADGLNLQLDLGRVARHFGSSPSRPTGQRPLSAAAALPDPRALKGANASTAARLRLNLKGFSLLEAREREDPEIRVRRIRNREWRRPVLSVTLQKRF